jgi:hypothetical protein
MGDFRVDMTQVEALHVALQQSFSPDSGVRDPAEASIKHLKFVPGATQMLLHITEEKQVRDRWRERDRERDGKSTGEGGRESGEWPFVSFFLHFARPFNLITPRVTSHFSYRLLIMN